MKSIALLLFLLLATHSEADLFVTNFTAINGSAQATGVWRNETTGTDLTIPVSLSQTGGQIRPADGSSTQSILVQNPADLYNLWEDVPAFFPITPGINVFEPNFIGDYINVQTEETHTSTVTLDFGASVTDPVISFTDVEYRTTITFPSALTMLAGTSNLVVSGSSLTSNKTTAAGDPGIFGQEAAGSVKLTGTFKTVVITIAVALGDNTVGNEDRTGFVVSTMTPPQPATPGPPPSLAISRSGNQVTLTWPQGRFSSIEMSGNGTGLTGWSPIPGLNPATTGTWTGNLPTLGQVRYFRGKYTP